jgi:hypothetical protein
MIMTALLQQLHTAYKTIHNHSIETLQKQAIPVRIKEKKPR